jgi:hypothetical protein
MNKLHLHVQCINNVYICYRSTTQQMSHLQEALEERKSAFNALASK